jgi:hypothetical protein
MKKTHSYAANARPIAGSPDFVSSDFVTVVIRAQNLKNASRYFAMKYEIEGRVYLYSDTPNSHQVSVESSYPELFPA